MDRPLCRAQSPQGTGGRSCALRGFRISVTDKACLMDRSSQLPSLPLLQRRTMQVLVVAQLLGACGLAAGVTSGALLAEHLTGTTTTAGLPLSLLVLGSGLGAV